MATKKSTTKDAKGTKKAAKPQAAAAAGDVVTLLDGSKVPAAELAHIMPALRPFAVRADSLTRDASNARLHGEQNLDSIKRSFGRFGQQHLVLFDERRVIRAGNGRHEAAELLGWRWVAAVPTNLRGPELKAFAIADNRSSELAEWYRDELERQLDQLKAELPDFDGLDLGFSDEQIEAMLADKPDPKKAHGFAGDPVGGGEKGSHGGGGGPGGGGGGRQDPDPIFQIVIKCKDEADQAAWIEELTNRSAELEQRGAAFTAPSL